MIYLFTIIRTKGGPGPEVTPFGAAQVYGDGCVYGAHKFINDLKRFVIVKRT